MLKMSKWLVGIMAVLLLSAVIADAQDFPKGQINYLNPFNPEARWNIAAGPCSPIWRKAWGAFRHFNTCPGQEERCAGLSWRQQNRTAIRSAASAFPILSAASIFEDVAFKTDDFVISTLWNYTPIGLR
jgi:hypothetical protein